MSSKQILALAGGVGGAKLALGLAHVLPPNALTVVVNTGDDDTFHGLRVCPDLDTVMYTLAGIANPETGWGRSNETFRVLNTLEEYGASTWFHLGDLDLGTHLRRTDLLLQGHTLSEVTYELCSRMGIQQIVVPMTDKVVQTVALTVEGALAFQEYFVHRRCEPQITGLRIDGADEADPAPGFEAALATATAIVFCPSNPLVSIGPILALRGIQHKMTSFKGLRVAVSPLVGGKAIRGPAAKMMAELGEEVSCVGVARRYQGFCDVMVIDEIDLQHAPAIKDLGMRVVATNTIMETEDEKIKLATFLMALLDTEGRRL